MNKRDDIRNCEDGMERQGPTQASPNDHSRITQTLGMLKECAYNMSRVCLEYAYSMSRVCLKHACATSMLRRCYADATPMVRLQYAKSMSGVCQEPVSCERPVRHLRTLSPSRANTLSASFGQLLRFTLLFVVMMMGSVVWGQTTSHATGVDGTTVYLNDLEDHNWSYYQPASELPDGYPARMCSPYPRNVKITYYGYGANTLSTTDAAAPAASTFTVTTTASDVKVGIGEDENTFVYYKTLERDDNNRFPYELIPNPFSVRPKSGNIYTGFYKWRVKSVTGGSIYSASNGGTQLATASTSSTENVMLDAETTYYFQPTDNALSNANNATSMQIELEALWAPAEVITGNSFSKGYNSVERNFRIVSNGTNNTLDDVKIATPCTYTSFYPNGTTNGTTGATLSNRNTRRATFTPTADSKVEYMLLNGNNYNINADAHNLTLGRGIGAANGTYSTNTFHPVNASKNVDINFRLRLESGTFGTLYLMADGTNNSYQRFQNNFTLGSDYDRAKGDDTKLIVAGEGVIKNGNSEFSQANQDKPTLTCIIKSGAYQRNYWNNNNNAQYNYGFYCCQDHDDRSYPGLVSLTVEGGHFASIIGGRGNYTEGCITQDSLAFTLRFKGGLVENSIYGASSNNATYGSRRLIFTGGEVRGWIAAGCNGTSDNDDRGQTRGDSYVYVGGNTKVGNAGEPRTNNSAVGGNVFGAGRGGNRQYASIKTSHVAVADNAEVLHNVFGGGFHGHIVNTSNVFVLGGTTHGNVFGGGDNNSGDNRSIPTVNIHMTGGLVEGGVYGGSNENGIVSSLVNMHIDGGQVGTTSKTANIHGGGLGSPTRVNGNVELTLGTKTDNVDGTYTCSGDVIVYGDVYGGSALGYVNGGTNGQTASNTYHTHVTLNKGIINGSLYGGGLGEGTTAANVYGPVTVTVNGGSVKDPDGDAPDSNPGSIFGCNNVYGSPQRAVSVTVNATDPTTTDGSGNKIYAINGVYGGGNQAHYDYDNADNPTVTINGCESSIKDVYGGGNAAAVPSTHVTIKGGDIDRVFGGGNGESGTPAHIGYKNKTENSTASAYNANGNVTLDINGGTINQVFGGSNAHGTIKGSIAIGIAKSGTCEMHIGEVYGGGNEAAGNAGTITIGCTGGDTEGIGDVYGGANAADVNNNIELTITGGSIQRVFGGNNASGSINGGIQVNVNWKTGNEACGYNYLGSVFGGGNLAPYTIPSGKSLAVNILNGTVSGNVYGGGAGNLVDGNDRGVAGKVTGSPTVTIGDSDDNHTAKVLGDVYGGGDAADVAGTPVIVVNDCNTEIGYLYGGGNAADVDGTNITVNGGIIHHDAFGGGHGDKDASNPSKYADVKGGVVFNVYGGTIDRVFAGSNSKGDITGTSALTINKTGTCDMKIREAYGGGNEAAGNAGTVTIGCTGDIVTGDGGHAAHPENIGTTLEGIGTVYGGANKADIGTSSQPSNITLNINSGMVNNVFGGNNTSGDIYGTIAVNINKNAQTCGWYVGNVFGGGNLAAYTGSPTVTVTNGDISHNVYGGGNEAGVGGSTVNINGGSVLDGVYGGCNTSGTVDGDILVNLTGGTVGAANAKANVHGGGYGSATATSGNVEVNIGDSGTPNTGTAVIYGDVYGGSALGSVNGTSYDTSAPKHTYVNLNKGTIHGDAYGGGLGSKASADDTGVAAYVYGDVKVIQDGVIFVKGTTSDDDGNTVVNAGRIFGCNNLNGSPKGTVLVLVKKTTPTSGTDHVKGTYEMAAVYGGGNLAAYDPTTPTATGQYAEDGHDATGKPLQVVINGCDDVSIEYVYGGGNAAATPATDVVVLGAFELGNVFGGGNGKDKISYDGTTWSANPGADVGIKDQTAYATNSSTGTYGTGKSLASLLGGTIHYAFGGSNTKGNVLSEATVYLNESDGGCPLKIDEVYGGGNEAYMAGDTQIQLGCISYLKEIYGGAKAADLGGNVVLTITSGSFDRVFGGNNVSGCINGSITVNIEETGCHPIVIGELYAGGNQAGYSIYGYKEVTEGGKQVWKPRESATDAGTGPTTPFASPELNVKSFTSIGRIFGGGFGETAVMVGDPTVNINEVEGTKSNKNVTNGTYNYDADATTGHFDTNGNFKGWAIEYKDDSQNPTTVTSTVNVPTHNKGKIGAIGTVFGGGNAAKVIGNTNVNIGTLSTITYVSGTDHTDKTVVGVDIRENVFGGGNQADVTGNTNVVVGR